MSYRFVFFDAGNTLIFADHSRTLAPILEAGYQPGIEQLYAAERFAKRRMDLTMEDRLPVDSGRQRVDSDYWSLYYAHLLEGLRAPSSFTTALIAATQRSGNWDRIRPGTSEALGAIRNSGRRLGVIANSDGHIEDILRSVGLGGFFESFTDSGLVGSEKPDPSIFRRALGSLDAAPEESIYIGDIYCIDYLGAKSVGMPAILMDVAGTYRNSGLPRVESLEEFQNLVI